MIKLAKLLKESTLSSDISPNRGNVKKFFTNLQYSDYDLKNSNFAKKEPKQWSIDDFVGFVENNMLGDDSLDPKLAKILGLPAKVNIVKFFSDRGTNLNNNTYWNKYQSWRSALYDMWEHIKKFL